MKFWASLTDIPDKQQDRSSLRPLGFSFKRNLLYNLTALQILSVWACTNKLAVFRLSPESNVNYICLLKTLFIFGFRIERNILGLVGHVLTYDVDIVSTVIRRWRLHISPCIATLHN
jgi:hypothetical protein